MNFDELEKLYKEHCPPLYQSHLVYDDGTDPDNLEYKCIYYEYNNLFKLLIDIYNLNTNCEDLIWFEDPRGRDLGFGKFSDHLDEIYKIDFNIFIENWKLMEEKFSKVPQMPRIKVMEDYPDLKKLFKFVGKNYKKIKSLAEINSVFC